MADDQHETPPPGLPGARIVENFSDNIRKTIADGIAGGTADTIERFRGMLARWVAGAVVGAGLMAALVTGLTSSRAAADFAVHHADGLNEVCALLPDTPAGPPTFVCHLEPR